MKQVYQHTFRNGKNCTISFKIGENLIWLNVDPPILAEECSEEFGIWIEQVVAEDLLPRLTPEQVNLFARAGLEFLRETSQKPPGDEQE